LGSDVSIFAENMQAIIERNPFPAPFRLSMQNLHKMQSMQPLQPKIK
jgi:hypothetical protein